MTFYVLCNVVIVNSTAKYENFASVCVFWGGGGYEIVSTGGNSLNKSIWSMFRIRVISICMKKQQQFFACFWNQVLQKRFVVHQKKYMFIAFAFANNDF